MKKLALWFGLVLASAIVPQAVSASWPNVGHSSPACGHHEYADRVVQIAPLERLMAGGYDGTTTVADVQKSSDFGIGTFEGLDGEMIMLNGVVYQAPANGKLRVARPHEIIPFATLTRFHSEKQFHQSTPMNDYATLQAYLNEAMPDQNQILAIKVWGIFKTLKVRAPQKQVEPYPTLTEALTTQAVFDLKNVTGTFVGFRFPSYVGTMNSPGYHFHFIADDRSIGGHVLEVSTARIFTSVETVEQYDVTMGSAD